MVTINPSKIVGSFLKEVLLTVPGKRRPVVSESGLRCGFLSYDFHWNPQPPQSFHSFVKQSGFRAFSHSKKTIRSSRPCFRKQQAEAMAEKEQRFLRFPDRKAEKK